MVCEDFQKTLNKVPHQRHCLLRH